jgi:hypothetical protein
VDYPHPEWNECENFCGRIAVECFFDLLIFLFCYESSEKKPELCLIFNKELSTSKKRSGASKAGASRLSAD